MACGAGAAVGLLIGGGAGLVGAVVVALCGERLLRTATPDASVAAATGLLRDLPGACDLLGVCLAAGVPVAGALAAVGDAVPGPVGAQLRTVAALYRLGAEPSRAWVDVPAELAALGRVLVRAGESGAAVVPALRSLAADGRAAARVDAEAAVRRAGVWVLAPLGACSCPHSSAWAWCRWCSASPATSSAEPWCPQPLGLSTDRPAAWGGTTSPARVDATARRAGRDEGEAP